ncbi:hypothetical protein AcW1_006939 [Taiwanofungus camphoratus]|nr:hypothetical protein AcV5_002746 [Antrodia cinnamomea]KAI0924985.1 hypothetical protein AcW2_005701 [Antrodia cinnamomea]KAI0955323.1 hypothetical protein AcW1_006939 [Antrodia cinnamomea]
MALLVPIQPGTRRSPANGSFVTCLQIHRPWGSVFTSSHFTPEVGIRPGRAHAWLIGPICSGQAKCLRHD